jgi:hypothetical protein
VAKLCCVASGTYEDVGQTAVIAAEPAVVHFGGFQPGATLKQIVRLCNISSSATRVHVVPPDSENFKASTVYCGFLQHIVGSRQENWQMPKHANLVVPRQGKHNSRCLQDSCIPAKADMSPQPDLLPLQVTHQRKPGSIAPGLAEHLVIEFTGQQLRYHYDCIRVQTEVSYDVACLLQLLCFPICSIVVILIDGSGMDICKHCWNMLTNMCAVIVLAIVQLSVHNSAADTVC